jgi:hypothetical protein
MGPRPATLKIWWQLLVELVAENPRKAAALLMWALTGYVLLFGVLAVAIVLREIADLLERLLC